MGNRDELSGGFVRHFGEMLASPAWRHLPHGAKALLSRLELEHTNQSGTKNGELIVIYSDFDAFGIRRKSLPKYISQSVALGFLEVMEQGKRAIADYRIPARYRLTYVDGRSTRLMNGATSRLINRHAKR